MRNFVEIQRAQAFSKVIEIVRAHLKAPVLEGRRQSRALIDQFEPIPSIDLRKFRSLSKRSPPILSLLGTWTKELIDILEVGEDACQAFIDRFAKLSLMTDANLQDLGYNLTLIFKAFGRTLHYLLKGVRRSSNFYSLGMTPLSEFQDQDSFFHSTMRSSSIPEQVPYKVKFRFRELLLNVDIKGLLITMINSQEKLEQHFYFYHILSAMLLEESSIQEVQGSLKPQFQVQNGSKVYKPINMHFFESFVIEAKTLLLQELPKQEFWYERVLKPLRESIFLVSSTNIVSPLQSQNYIVNEEIQRLHQIEITLNREEKLRQKIITKLREVINQTGVGVTDLAIEVYGEMVCAQHIVLNARFLRYLEPSQVVTKIVLVMLPLLMHLIKVREEWQNSFKLLTSEKGSIDIDRTKQYYSLGMRGTAGGWWIKKAFEYPRIHLTRRPEAVTEFTMSDYVAMIDSEELNIPKKGFRELNKMQNFRGTTSNALSAQAEHTHYFRLEKLLEKEKGQIKKKEE